MANLECIGAGSHKVLSSNWGKLNTFLLAEIYEVDKQGIRVADKDGNTVSVMAGVIESANLNMSFGWKSQFESVNLESSQPSLVAMAHSGMFNPLLDVVSKNTGIKTDGASDILKQFEGRTSVTRINSMQTFGSMPPIKLDMTLSFRAIENAYKEVMQPVWQLLMWAMPQMLSRNAEQFDNAYKFITSTTKTVDQGIKTGIETLLPSKSPVNIGIMYKGLNLSPFVIESISLPLDSPIEKNGYFTHLKIPVSMSSVTAWDRQDLQQVRTIVI